VKRRTVAAVSDGRCAARKRRAAAPRRPGEITAASAEIDEGWCILGLTVARAGGSEHALFALTATAALSLAAMLQMTVLRR
jgi:hypothetical protein